METNEISFQRQIENKVSSFLGLNWLQYSDLIFCAGMTAQRKNSSYKSYFTGTGAFWDCFTDRLHFLNLKIVVQLDFGIECNLDADDYWQIITEKFEMPKRTINLINKQYRLQFSDSLEKDCLKPLIKQRKTKTPKKKNNQLEINLNTI